MKCNDARDALAANPHDDGPALVAHVHACEACAAYAREMQELDRRLLAALRVPVPAAMTAAAGAPDAPAAPTAAGTAPAVAPVTTGAETASTTPTTPPTPIESRRRERARTRRFGGFGGFALAASLVGAVLLGGLLWSAYPRESLASAIVGHMAHEPGSWDAEQTLPPAEIERALTRTGVRLAPGAVDVTYANLCVLRGEVVPHLVVRTPDGPVTVMVLPRERVERRQAFDEGRYRGVLVPAPRGALAVVTRDRADVDAVAAQALAAIRYVD